MLDLHESRPGISVNTSRLSGGGSKIYNVKQAATPGSTTIERRLQFHNLIATDRKISKNSGGGGNYRSNMYSVEKLVKQQTRDALEGAYMTKNNLSDLKRSTAGDTFSKIRSRHRSSLRASRSSPFTLWML